MGRPGASGESGVGDSGDWQAGRSGRDGGRAPEGGAGWPRMGTRGPGNWVIY